MIVSAVSLCILGSSLQMWQHISILLSPFIFSSFFLSILRDKDIFGHILPCLSIGPTGREDSVAGIRWLHNAWHINHRGAPCWLLDTHLANLTSLSQFILLFHFTSPWFHLVPYLSMHFLLFLPLHLRLIYCLFQPQNVSFQMTIGLYNTAFKSVTLI